LAHYLICRKPSWYDKPLKRREFLSRQADIRRVTGTGSVDFRPSPLQAPVFAICYPGSYPTLDL